MTVFNVTMVSQNEHKRDARTVFYLCTQESELVQV